MAPPAPSWGGLLLEDVLAWPSVAAALCLLLSGLGAFCLSEVLSRAARAPDGTAPI